MHVGQVLALIAIELFFVANSAGHQNADFDRPRVFSDRFFDLVIVVVGQEMLPQSVATHGPLLASRLAEPLKLVRRVGSVRVELVEAAVGFLDATAEIETRFCDGKLDHLHQLRVWFPHNPSSTEIWVIGDRLNFWKRL